MPKRRYVGSLDLTPALGAAASAAFRYGFAYVSNKRRKTNTTEMSGITRQHDTQLQYRRKKGGGKNVRKWENFLDKIEQAQLQTAATKSIVFNNTGNIGNVDGEQAIYAINIYSGIANSDPFDVNRDLYRIVTNDPDPRTADPNNTGTVLQRKYVFKSGVLDLTFRVSPTFPVYTGNAQTSLATNGKVEMDIYEVAYKQDAEYNNFTQLWLASDQQTPVVRPGSNTSLTYNTLGATPFQFPELCRTITILSKTKHFVDVGEVFTYQKRFPGNRHIQKNFIIGELGGTSFAIGGQTYTVLCIIKGVPGWTGSIPNMINKSSPAVNVAVSATRTYEYTFLDSGEQTADAANPNP